MKKTVLILEDLAIHDDVFLSMVSSSDMPYEFKEIDGPEDITDHDNVIGIVTIKKSIDSVDEKLLDKLPNIKFISVAFTGYDCVDMDEAKERGITVMNVPSYATAATAELAVALTMNLLREIPEGHQRVINGKWDLDPGIELSGKTIGIIGTGRIGAHAAKIFAGFGCKLIGYSNSENDEFKNIGGSYVSSVTELCEQSDIVSIHVPLNDATKGMFGEKEFAAMKPSAYFINVARGPIVDTQALVNALEQKQIAGAGVDVFDQEPIAPDNPLLKAPNVILTPHIAYKTKESLIRRAQVTIDNIKSFAGGNPENVVS